MPAHITPITRQTYKEAARVLGEAFVDEPVSLVVYRGFSPRRRVRALAVDFSAELQVCLRKGLPLQVVQDGRLVAAALVYPPGGYPLPWTDQWLFLLKSVLGNGLYDLNSWLEWQREVDKLRPTKPHYYLEYIGVEPTRQGCGLGTVIMQHLIAKADQDGAACYLENASPRNLAFYQRFGFEVLCEKEIIGFPSWFMWREPLLPRENQMHFERALK